jgi:hypothetical protein
MNVLGAVRRSIVGDDELGEGPAEARDSVLESRRAVVVRPAQVTSEPKPPRKTASHSNNMRFGRGNGVNQSKSEGMSVSVFSSSAEPCPTSM